jgi:hypothetical protein
MSAPAPDWVSFEADKTGGLDLLGLRAPVQALGNDLFDGVTTVTPKLRYMSVISWIVWRYAQTRLPDDRPSFFEFAAAQESAFVMANRLKSRSVIQLVVTSDAETPATRPSSVRRREILLPANASSQIQNTRPIRSETRATLVASIARGRAWLDEIIANPNATTEGIAKRERCSPRKINKTISLAFLSPDLVKAAIEGTLPHGMGLARLFDLPAEWSRQRQVLGLAAQ